jgi:hypothetical protein
MDPKVLFKESNAEASVPAWARFTINNVEGAGHYPPLDVHWSAHFHLQPGEGELPVARFLCIDARGGGSVDDLGAPPRASAASAFLPIPLFRGNGVVLLTTQRVIGLLLSGVSVAGDFDEKRGELFTFTVANQDVAAVTLQRERKLFGVKDRRIKLGLAEDGTLLLELWKQVDETNRARSVEQPAVMHQFVDCIADARLIDANPTEQELLTRAKEGDWRTDDLTVTAVLEITH